jgi:excisionase family DNA binding protein
MNTINRLNPKKNPQKQLITIAQPHLAVKDVASYCMVSTTTVRRWMKDGKLKSIKLPSNQHRISVTDFKFFLAQYNIPMRKDLNDRL